MKKGMDSMDIDFVSISSNLRSWGIFIIYLYLFEHKK